MTGSRAHSDSRAGGKPDDDDAPKDWTGAIETLAAKWADWYHIWRYASGIRWRRKDGYGGVQYAAAPDQADRDINSDYELYPVRMRPRTAAS